MKAKLVKEYGDFYLVSDKEIQKGDEYVKLDNRPRMLLLGTTIASAKVSKLSLKNCEAIANGYDLDELAKHCSKQEYYDWGGEVFEQDYLDTRYTAYKQGFQKALEILGDKKFSEEDIKFAFNKGYLMKFNPSDEYQKTLNDLRQSLQQTEWDCIVEMEYYDTLPPTRQTGLRPKLDADGCLILKRK